MAGPARRGCVLFAGAWGVGPPRARTGNARQGCDARLSGAARAARRAGAVRRARMCAERVEAPRLRPVGADGCGAGEVAGIASRVAGWLDGEYPEESLAEPHAAVGAAAARHYADIRQAGEDDVGAVLLELGARLEREPPPLFADLFVGPWEVANSVTDMVIAGARAFGTARPPQPLPKDRFDRYNFLQHVLDGEVAKEAVNGAVALAVGFRTHKFGWDGGEVEDKHFKQFGDVPPDILGDETSAEWSDTLAYMKKMLQIGADEDPNGKREESLNTVVEAVYGFEIARIRRGDETDQVFKKREVIVKWLHLHAGY